MKTVLVAIDFGEASMRALDQARSERLKGLLTPDETLQYRAKVVTRVGKPADEILAYARERAVNLIVIGRDGHGSGAAVASFGSVAHAVARQAPCPVLVVPATSD